MVSTPVIGNIIIVCGSIFKTATEFPRFGILLILSLFSLYYIRKEYRKKAYFLLAVTFICAGFTAYTRPSFIYYYGYILSYGFGLSLISIVTLLGKLGKTRKNNSGLTEKLIPVLFIAIYVFLMFTSKNLYFIFKPKDFLVQYRMAETINQTPDAKLLTYDVMDSGFYTASGLLPQNRFFCYLNIESTYPAILEEQNRLIAEGYFDYIVTGYYFEDDWDNYELIMTETHPFIDYTGEYAHEGFKLYKKVQTT